MKNIYFWACDICKSSGEGILARSFIKKLKIYNKNYKIINICKQSKFQKRNLEQNCSSFFHKYIFPLYGIYVLWKYHLNGKITCYINYLPLWNILIFLLLPQKTILGPITGSYPLKKWSIKLNFLYKLSSIILNIKYNKILFATNFFRKYFKKNNNCCYNFIISNIKILKTNKKKYDFIFYYRDHYNKGNDFLGKIINYLANNKYKIAVIGDKIYNTASDNIFCYGYVNRNLALKIIGKSKYSILSKENLFSYFMQDCLSKQLVIFYNKDYSKFISGLNKNINPKNYNNLIPIDYNSTKAAIKIIKFKIKNKSITIKKINQSNLILEKNLKVQY
jgi:hypothetical protein